MIILWMNYFYRNDGISDTTWTILWLPDPYYYTFCRFLCVNSISSWPSKSYPMPPRRRGLGNGSTPVSRHITIRLRKVVGPAKLGCCAWLSLGVWGALLVWVGGPCPGVSDGRTCWSLGSCAG